MSDKDNLTLGIQAAKNGDTGKAKDYLANVVRENPRSEEGWLWLGRCLQDQEQCKHCFERVLQLNPQNVEAQQELDNLFLSIAVDRSNTLPASSKDIPISSEEKSREDNWISNPLFLRIMGIIAGLCVCGIPILFVINSGLLDPLTGSLPGKAPRASPTTVSFSVPSASPTIWNAATFISATASPSVVVNINTWQARDLIAQGKHAEAIILLDQLIQSAPKADEAYFLRAISYQNLMGQQRSMFEFQDYLDRGLVDIDKAIALRPDNGDYYMLRRKLLVDLASMQNFRADSVRVAEYALENIGAAISLGSTLEEYPDRLYLIDLIYSNQCEVALQRTLEMIDRTDPNDQSIGGLYHIQSQAHICLGEADKAIKLSTNTEVLYDENVA